MEEIIIATSNKGKVREAQEILKKFKVIPMSEIGVNIDVEEDGKTFKENAIKKAQIIAQEINKRCLADDSGIEIEYLNGFPGVITKRWHSGTDRERNIALLEKLIGVPKEKRKIKFITAIALSDGNTTICKEGIIEGYVANELRGNNGFGFDEIFELENGKTLAELTQDEKNEISARKIALEQIKKEINNLLDFYNQNQDGCTIKKMSFHSKDNQYIIDQIVFYDENSHMTYKLGNSQGTMNYYSWYKYQNKKANDQNRLGDFELMFFNSKQTLEKNPKEKDIKVEQETCAISSDKSKIYVHYVNKENINH